MERLHLQPRNGLTAFNQDCLHDRMLKQGGPGKFAKHGHAESIEQMTHADPLVDSILMLGGLPTLQNLGRLMIGERVVETLHCDLKIGSGAHGLRKGAIAHGEAVRDAVSRDVLQPILDDTAQSIGHLERQIALVATGGEQNWLQRQRGEVS